jgi:16S rRNA (adenine1518-N6/adenine1519-N6)-dimethyltransferase
MEIAHTPRKRFGQNFLIDQQVIDTIVATINPEYHDNLVEIGPGLGALTQKILPKVKALNVIELDEDLIPALQKACWELGVIHIHPTDVLHFDFSKLAKPNQPLRIFGNLPYNISTQILFRLCKFQAIIKDAYFMVQKEVAERLAAQPCTRAYGRLSVMIQYTCQVECLFHVPPQAFNPAPKVTSTFIRVKPHADKPYTAHDPMIFDQVVRQAFNQRRKTIANSLKDLISAAQLELVGVAPTLRAEDVSLSQYVNIANLIVKENLQRTDIN